MISYCIAQGFSQTPGGRKRTDGSFSGEEFRDDVLKQLYSQAKENNEQLLIDLDGGYGYGSSFLEEAFGGLQRQYKGENILDIIVLKSDDDPMQTEKIKKYVLNSL